MIHQWLYTILTYIDIAIGYYRPWQDYRIKIGQHSMHHHLQNNERVPVLGTCNRAGGSVQDSTCSQVALATHLGKNPPSLPWEVPRYVPRAPFLAEAKCLELLTHQYPRLWNLQQPSWQICTIHLPHAPAKPMWAWTHVSWKQASEQRRPFWSSWRLQGVYKMHEYRYIYYTLIWTSLEAFTTRLPSWHPVAFITVLILCDHRRHSKNFCSGGQVCDQVGVAAGGCAGGCGSGTGTASQLCWCLL